MLEKTEQNLKRELLHLVQTAYKAGEDRSTVEIPGAYDADEVLNELGKTQNHLYFCTAAKKLGTHQQRLN